MKRLVLSTILLVSAAISANAQTARTASFGQEPVAVLRTYPNPAISNITLDFQRNYDKGFTIQIYNFLGRKMYEGVNVGQRTNINLSDYTRGVYIYQLYDRGGKMVETGKFQVSK